MMLKLDLIKRFYPVERVELEGGKCVALRCVKGDWTLYLVTIHLEPLALVPVKEEILRKVKRLAPSSNSASLLLIGDFNFVSPDEGRLDTMTGQVRMARDPTHAIVERVMAGYVELAQPDFTHVEVVAGTVAGMGRIDRCYTNIGQPSILDMKPEMATLGNLVKDIHISDHAPSR